MKFILTLLMTLGASTHASPLQDGQETNGGDPYAAEFLFVVDSTLQQLPLTLPLENEAAIQREVLEEARTAVLVASVEVLNLDGREVAAVNQPLTIPPRIVVSRSAWKSLDIKQKRLLVLHELLPIAGIYDDHYKKSLRLWQLLP